MRLVFTTEDFVYAGRRRPGFPLILGDDMKPAQPFHDHLHWLLLERGKPLDLKTWENYGRHLWDFARFLSANDVAWNHPFRSEGESVVRVYRDWQAEDLMLDPGTINRRLRIVTGFYRWAVERGLLYRLPFTYSDVAARGVEVDRVSVMGGAPRYRRPDVFLDEWEKEPAFLTAEQLKVARRSIRSTSQRLLFDLMARVGLRSVEACTFPLAYVFDPTVRSYFRPGTLIDVRLDPRDMEIKFDKPRVVHVPYSLMEDMYAYVQFERNRHIIPDSEPKTLLVTVNGSAYQKGSAHKVMLDLGRKIGFPIRPLMLRHSYAVHTLLLLRANPDIKLEPLIYVRDRLGHASVQTTMVYLKQIERLVGAEALSMMEEFDRLYDVTSALGAHSVNA
ncbi:tyrosine-type recombinase/integrase [Burkholderia pseudomallei]|uniref:tyrosine-type recombinase/integrase n=1 Tax=Burkholderia pseudomallei TaxID=28450 RepID=UPI0005726806|nr:site-specific integrase [Burkholderia pseudomallei]AJX79450.1 phage integrase family protein [Burkholderia pseudomallei MSHR2543]